MKKWLNLLRYAKDPDMTDPKNQDFQKKTSSLGSKISEKLKLYVPFVRFQSYALTHPRRAFVLICCLLFCILIFNISRIHPSQLHTAPPESFGQQWHKHLKEKTRLTINPEKNDSILAPN